MNKAEIKQIRATIDFSKYPTPECYFRLRSRWVLHVINEEALEMGLSYGNYVAKLEHGSVQRPKESLLAEAFLFIHDYKELKDEIARITEL